MEKIDIKAQVTERLQALQRNGVPVPTQTPTQVPSDAPQALKQSPPSWYELDRYVKLRDPLMVVGISLALFGVSSYSTAMTYILAGVILVVLSWMMAR